MMKDERQHLVRPHQDHDDAQSATDAERAELIEVIGLLVFGVRVSHDGNSCMDQSEMVNPLSTT